jgi:hypothetical protein
MQIECAILIVICKIKSGNFDLKNSNLSFAPNRQTCVTKENFTNLSKYGVKRYKNCTIRRRMVYKALGRMEQYWSSNGAVMEQ